MSRKFKEVKTRVSEEVSLKLEILARKDNRTVENLIETMILNELGEINYDFNLYHGLGNETLDEIAENIKISEIKDTHIPYSAYRD